MPLAACVGRLSVGYYAADFMVFVAWACDDVDCKRGDCLLRVFQFHMCICTGMHMCARTSWLDALLSVYSQYGLLMSLCQVGATVHQHACATLRWTHYAHGLVLASGGRLT